eukprot:COSAG02_NODE_44161_length_368_cov_1.141264_1_plen_56_part_01
MYTPARSVGFMASTDARVRTVVAPATDTHAHARRAATVARPLHASPRSLAAAGERI